jgi:threonine dehydrogenase-like Zn-dependent dehydrogenase
MKKVIISGDRQVDLVDVPDPKPIKDWVLVKVHASALCTEYKSYLAGRPLNLGGHEGVGEVIAMAQPGRVKVGDRVVILPQYACGKCALCMAGDFVYCENKYDLEEFTGLDTGQGTFAHYVVKPDWLLPPIPEGVSYEHATMAIDGIGASFGAFQSLNINASDTVLISGLGPVGLGAVVNACYRSCRIIGIEPIRWRRDRALQMGIDFIFDPGEPGLLGKILELTEGRGVSCALDCSGKIQSQRLCIDATRRRGKVAFIGETEEELAIRVSPDMIRKGLTLIGSWLYNLGDYYKVMQVIQDSPLIDLLISHTMPMSQIQDGFELLASGRSAKIVVRPWE